jgi:hypothetical protein
LLFRDCKLPALSRIEIGQNDDIRKENPNSRKQKTTKIGFIFHFLNESHGVSFQSKLATIPFISIKVSETQQEKKACIESKLAADNFRRQTIRILVCNIEIGQ